MPKRVVFRRYGDVHVLESESFPSRPLAADQVRLRVYFAGVNYADVLARRGFYKWAPPFPTCLGFEVAGVISEVGEAVTDFAVGERVLAITRFGGYAEEVVLERERVWKLPPQVSLESAAALPAVSITAWQALREVARVRAGESILIQAVAGGVGLAALQLAKHLGLTVYGTASSDDKLAFALEHGLDVGINYARHDFEHELMRITKGRGVDFVLDSLGGEALRKGYRCVARGGLLVTIGAAQVAPARREPLAFLRAGAELVRGGLFHPFQLIEANRGIAGLQVLLLWEDLARLDRGMRELLALFASGVLTPHVDRVFALEEAADAHALIESRKSKGKVVLRCAT